LATGGVAPTEIGVIAACAQIAYTVSEREKNEIFAETIMSMGAGL